MNVWDEFGCLVLFFVVYGCYVDVVKVLIERGCDLKLINRIGFFFNDYLFEIVVV